MTPERAAATVGVLAIVLACGDSDGAGSGTGESGAEGSTGGTTAVTTPATETGPGSASESTGEGASTGAVDTSGGGGTTGPDVELQHGFVRVQLQRAASQESDPFAGTERVQITLNYEQCLFDFYVEEPDWTPTGPDGESVFGSADLGGEGWFDRLCHVDVPDLVDCEVASIEQQLDPIPVLRITYVVSGELDGRVLPFGPLPTAALAGCVDPALPSVRLGSGSLVVGFDGANAKIWDGTTFAPMSAATDDETAIAVDIVTSD
ncbi:MAG TPA: hypothetical protein VFG69_17800 [Nannocystaceae bacterium]|nr:hypothetical protein [Nannocystaceae bacterium]